MTLILHLSVFKCFVFFKFTMPSQKSDKNNSIKIIFIKIVVKFNIIKIYTKGRSRFSEFELRDWRSSLANGFFQSPFEANEMFCLLNILFFFNNQKQPLKCVRRNSYLDLWSDTLYIIWQGVHLLVKSKITDQRN